MKKAVTVSDKGKRAMNQHILRRGGCLSAYQQKGGLAFNAAEAPGGAEPPPACLGAWDGVWNSKEELPFQGGVWVSGGRAGEVMDMLGRAEAGPEAD